jgi:hypothetical protein
MVGNVVIAQPTTQKYRSKAVYWNLITKTVMSLNWMEQYRVNGKLQIPKCIARFDSQHEFKVYLELVRMYGEDSIIRQYPVDICNPCCCYPKGKTWKVDFAIQFSPTSYLPHMFVEAKGAFLPEFATTLAMCEITNPDLFSDLFIVFGNKYPKDSQVLKNLLKSDMKSNLLTFPELKDLSRLI